METKPTLVIVGAGVIGLSTALRAQASFATILIAEHFPSDGKSIKYTSCWAGAHHSSSAPKHEKLQHGELSRLRSPPGQILTACLPGVEDEEFDLIKSYVQDFRVLDAAELPPGVARGVKFSTIMIDTPAYLQYLYDQFITKGGVIVRAHLSHLSDIPALLPLGHSNLQAIINCSGIGALELVGDEEVYPTRGQTVLVRAPWIKDAVTRKGEGGVYTYVIPRKSGEVILGGTADANDWEPAPRKETTQMVLSRALALCPDLLPPDKRAVPNIANLDIIEECCGLRPTRKGGIRLEAEKINVDDEEILVVHNYGHGGFGFQSSWGSARMALDLVRRRERDGGT